MAAGQVNGSEHRPKRTARENARQEEDMADRIRRYVAVTRPPGRQPLPAIPSASGETPAETRPAYRSLGTQPNPLSKGPKKIGKASINNIPGEILTQIFHHLDLSSLLQAAYVCKRWYALATDNLLWQGIYKCYAKVNNPQAGAADPGQKLPPAYWKNLCIKQCSEWRNKRFLRQLQEKKVHPYTGLPKNVETVLSQAGITYQLSLVDAQNKEHTVDSDKIFWQTMSSSVRWYTLDFLPLCKVCKVRILACLPLFYNKNGKAEPGSPYQRSLLWEADMRLSDYTTPEHAMGSDDQITTYRLPGDLLLATWNADGEIAFMAAGLHYHHLVKRSLLGTSTECYLPQAHTSIPDDIDPRYGLHGYTVTVEIRNMQNSFWSFQFRDCDSRCDGGFATFVLIDPEDRGNQCRSQPFLQKLMYLPWRTDLFKGIVKSVGWLDITMLDERGKVFYTLSAPIHACKPAEKDFYMEYSDGFTLIVDHVSEHAAVKIRMQDAPGERVILSQFEIVVPISVVNDWFGTEYPIPPQPKQPEQPKKQPKECK